MTAPDDHAVFQRFSRQLVGLARQHLGAHLRFRVDPEDVVQSAYKSLLHRYGTEALRDDESQVLRALLTTITIRKCADRARFHRAGIRDMRCEERVNDASDTLCIVAVSREPAPEHAAVLSELLESLLGQLEGDERVMLEMSLQGYSTPEISHQTGRAERSVRRLRERVRKYLEQQQAGMES